MTITKLLELIGEENITYQNLRNSIVGLEGDKVTFVTNMINEIDIVTGGGKAGLIIWVDDDIMMKAFDDLEGEK